MSDTKQFLTSDLPLAAYLCVKGLSLVKAKKTYNGKFEFILEDPNGEAEELSIEYINSDYCKFDNQIRSIKKLLYTNK